MNNHVTVLDGGMGRELHRIGAPFRQPEWSALALMEGPDWVVRAHRNFIDAGAHVITTNSYACVPFHIGETLFASRGHELASLAGSLARQAVKESGAPVRVAGSLPPVYGSYRPDLFVEAHAGELVATLVDALAPSVDLWLIETTGSIAEARCSLQAILAAPSRPTWVSFTLRDQLVDGRAVLRSGESIADARTTCGDQISAMLFNCSQPEVMAAAVKEAVGTRGDASLEIGVYANAFPEVEPEREANDGLSDIRADLTPPRYAAFAQEWVELGASIVGGCCGIRPDHIEAISRLFT